MQAYSEYKDSGIEWLGEIPAGWKVVSLRSLFEFRNEKNNPLITKDILSLSIANGVTLYSDKNRGGNKAKNDLTAYKIARRGDIVINSMNIIVGAVGLSKYFGAISPVYYAIYLRHENNLISFFENVFHNKGFQQGLLRLGKGILIKKSESGKLNTIRMKISVDDFKVVKLPLPPLHEQTAIAHFLDNKVGKIERLLAIKQQQIDLLKERQQILIQNAVTQGLNPNAPKKDSGIDWIGEIPAHWEVKKVEYLAKVDAGSTPDRSNPEFWKGDIPWIKTGEVNYSTILKTKEYITKAGFQKASLRLAPVNTLLIAMYGQGVTRGRVALLGIPATYNQACCGITFNHSVHEKYAYYFFVAAYTYIRDNGNETSQMNLSAGYISSIKIVVPPTYSQKEIITYIDHESGKINTAIQIKQQQIEKLNEYKTTLINAAVTGKIKVPLVKQVA